MPTARLGLIGTGFIGEVHLRALRHNARAEVRALADVDKGRLRKAQEAFEVPNVYTDVRTMLQSEELDGVIIATPDHLHREPVELAALGFSSMMLTPASATSSTGSRCKWPGVATIPPSSSSPWSIGRPSLYPSGT